LVIILLSLFVPIGYFVVNYSKFTQIEGFIFRSLFSLAFSLGALGITCKMIPIFMQMNYSKKIFGVDINKVEDITNKSDPDRREVPESLGIVPATVFLVTSILFQVFLNLDENNVFFFL
jgi:hypothetical protein